MESKRWCYKGSWPYAKTLLNVIRLWGGQFFHSLCSLWFLPLTTYAKLKVRHILISRKSGIPSANWEPILSFQLYLANRQPSYSYATRVLPCQFATETLTRKKQVGNWMSLLLVFVRQGPLKIMGTTVKQTMVIINKYTKRSFPSKIRTFALELLLANDQSHLEDTLVIMSSVKGAKHLSPFSHVLNSPIHLLFTLIFFCASSLSEGDLLGKLNTIPQALFLSYGKA